MSREEASGVDVIDGYRHGERDDGDQGDSDGKSQRLRPPIQAVQVEDLCDPYQGREVVKSIVDEEKEPEADLDASPSVTWCFLKGIQAVLVVTSVREGILREWQGTPSHCLHAQLSASPPFKLIG